MKDYSLMTDEQLVELAKRQDGVATNEIFVRYKNLLRSIIRKKKLFLQDGDFEDLLQEGMIGLFSAVNTYNGSVQFCSYAYKCVENTLKSAIEKSNCGKNRALNNSVSFDLNGGGDVGQFGLTVSPEITCINDESAREFLIKSKSALSPLENSILEFYLEGYSHDEIAKKTGKDVKAIGNALHRIRNKLKLLV